MPPVAQFCDVEIAQARNLDIKGRPVGQRRTDPDPRHRNQAVWRVTTSCAVSLWISAVGAAHPSRSMTLRQVRDEPPQ
jgi:hypothetical protein